jgi:amidase
VKTLTGLRIWNVEHKDAGAIRYGQSRLDGADGLDLAADKARYEADRANGLELSRAKGIDAAIEANTLDALLFPAGSAAEYASRAGYPGLTVPYGMVINYGPGAKGAQDKTRPFGVSFLGPLCSEPKMFALAYAFEQATKKRVPPKATP